MDGDVNDIFQKLNTMLSDKDMSDNLKNILTNISSSSEDTTEKSNQDSRTADNSGIDIETILKMKKIMDSFNNSENDSRSNLLLSLKPYLADNKKQKIDQYVKFLNLAKVIELMNPLGGDSKQNE